MMKINSKQWHTLFIGGATILCLSACQSTPKAVAVEPKPANHVVLMDPQIDDAMLPAIGEGLSKGQVTIYPLNGNIPTSAAGVGANNSPMVSAPVALPPQERIQLVPPGNMTDGSNVDSRVTVFSVDTGAPVAKVSKVPTITRPALQPPVPVTQLQSPFNEAGVPVAVPAPKKRPPKGMTY